MGVQSKNIFQEKFLVWIYPGPFLQNLTSIFELQKTLSKMDIAPWDKHWIKIDLMVLDGIQWYSMVVDGIRWYSMVFNGIQCSSEGFFGIRRDSLEFVWI